MTAFRYPFQHKPTATEMAAAAFQPLAPATVYHTCAMDRAAAAAALNPRVPSPYALAQAEISAQQYLTMRAAAADAACREIVADQEAHGHVLADQATPDFGGADAHAKVGIGAIEAEARSGLIEGFKDLRIAKVEQGRFREAYQIENEPQPAESGQRFLLLTGTAVILEAAVNFHAFEPAMRGGIFEAFLTALLYAVANVTGSIGFAAWIRELFARRRWRYALGWLGLVTYGFSLIEWVLLLSYYRAALANGSELPGVEAARALLQLPLIAAVSSLEAVVLMGVTVAASVATVISALVWHDKIPGYHRTQVRVQRAWRVLEALKRKHRRAVRRVIGHMQEDVECTRAKTVTARQQLREVIGAMKSTIVQYQAFTMALPTCLAEVSRRYRGQLARIGGYEVTSYQGEWDLGARIDVQPVLDRIEEFETHLNKLTESRQLEIDAENARLAITAIEGRMIEETERFFVACKAEAEGELAQDQPHAPPVPNSAGVLATAAPGV